MKYRIMSTAHSWPLLILRVALGIVMVPHGAQKLFGWFGGYGLTGTMGYFASLGIPAVFGMLAIGAEFFGGLALIAGFLTRVAALGIGSVLVVAAVLVHGTHGFFMNWFGTQAGEGLEYFILGGACAFVLVIAGGGAWSVDRVLSRDGTQDAAAGAAPRPV